MWVHRHGHRRESRREALCQGSTLEMSCSLSPKRKKKKRLNMWKMITWSLSRLVHRSQEQLVPVDFAPVTCYSIALKLKISMLCVAFFFTFFEHDVRGKNKTDVSMMLFRTPLGFGGLVLGGLDPEKAAAATTSPRSFGRRARERESVQNALLRVTNLFRSLLSHFGYTMRPGLLRRCGDGAVFLCLGRGTLSTFVCVQGTSQVAAK